jgi:HK97 family phage major capsid protein
MATSRINLLRDRKEVLLKELDGIQAEAGDKQFTAEQAAAFDAKMAEVQSIGADLGRYEAFQREQEAAVNAAPPAAPAKPGAPGKFVRLGEQLRAIVRASTPGEAVDPRLFQAASGLSESVMSDGGYLVQQDFSQTLLQRTFQLGQVLQRINKLQVSGNANGLKISAIKENSRANGSRWGGIQAFWQDEAALKIASKPEFRQIDLNLKKLTGLCYATDESLQDATALESVISQAFPLEFQFKLEDAIFNGTGAGQPLGIMNGGSLVTVAIEATQTIANTSTFLAANLAKMWSRLYAPSQQNAVWIINQDLLAKLYTATLGGTSAVSGIFIAPGRFNETPYATIFGRPVIPVEYAKAEGTPGDIMLVDLSQYVGIEKVGGIQSASSIHVRFLNDETTFRFVYRFDGAPVWNSPLTPYTGAATQSPFIALATRS